MTDVRFYLYLIVGLDPTFRRVKLIKTPRFCGWEDAYTVNEETRKCGCAECEREVPTSGPVLCSRCDDAFCDDESAGGTTCRYVDPLEDYPLYDHDHDYA